MKPQIITDVTNGEQEGKRPVNPDKDKEDASRKES
jgi:hypothetical protein